VWITAGMCCGDTGVRGQDKWVFTYKETKGRRYSHWAEPIEMEGATTILKEISTVQKAL
jgi:hypothetical protein